MYRTNGGVPTRGTEWLLEKDTELARQRYWRFVDQREEGCWPWLGPKGARGYGSISLGTKDTAIAAHRYSFYVHNGHLPADLLIRHTCDNPNCVNPSHLLPGTFADNARDKVERGRQWRGGRNPRSA